MNKAAIAAGGLRVEFLWLGDRYGHRIEAASGAVLVSEEGAPEDSWPPSPPLQSLHLETREHVQIAYLVGMAGSGHWSASIEADTDIECLALETAAFADLLKRHPEVGTKLLMNLARSLSQRLRLVSNELREREAG